MLIAKWREFGVWAVIGAVTVRQGPCPVVESYLQASPEHNKSRQISRKCSDLACHLRNILLIRINFGPCTDPNESWTCTEIGPGSRQGFCTDQGTGFSRLSRWEVEIQRSLTRSGQSHLLACTCVGRADAKACPSGDSISGRLLRINPSLERAPSFLDQAKIESDFSLQGLRDKGVACFGAGDHFQQTFELSISKSSCVLSYHALTFTHGL